MKLSREQFEKSVAAQMVDAARAMLDGRHSFIEGAQKICSLAHQIGLDRDLGLIAFIAVDSETDALPLGEVRKLWQAEALAKLQPEIDHAEAWARETCQSECEALIARFGGQDSETEEAG